MYYIENYFTDEIVDVTTDFEKALEICNRMEGSQVTTESDEVLYTNIDLPF